MAKAKKTETVETATEVATAVVTGSKPVIGVVWFKESDDYYNQFHYFSDDNTALDDIRKALNTNGDVWDKEEYPLIVKKLMKVHNKYWAAHDYFFFRTMHDNESDVRVEEDVCQDLVDSLNNPQMALLHTNHENQYAKLHAEMIVRGDLCKKYDFQILDIVTLGEADKLGI